MRCAHLIHSVHVVDDTFKDERTGANGILTSNQVDSEDLIQATMEAQKDEGPKAFASQNYLDSGKVIHEFTLVELCLGYAWGDDQRRLSDNEE